MTRGTSNTSCKYLPESVYKYYFEIIHIRFLMKELVLGQEAQETIPGKRLHIEEEIE